MPITLLALTITAFAIGTTEFIPVGLLPVISKDLHTPIATTGLIVSLYAVGVAVSAPILTSLLGRLNRKLTLSILLLIFIAGNVFAFFSTSFGLLVAARIVSSFAHGAFFSLGTIIATMLVPEDKKASAIALMFSGLTAAIIVGVPMGTWIGEHFGWRLTFLTVAVLGVIGLVGILALIPNNLAKSNATSIVQQFSVLFSPNLIIVYLITIVGYGANFIAFTFVSKILTSITHFELGSVNILLLVYGVAVSIGNIYGGKLTDKVGVIKSLYILFIGLGVTLIVLNFTMHYKVLTIITVIFWGFFAFANVPPLQSYVVTVAKRHTPHSVDVASGMNISAFNVGIALGSYLGGLVLSHMGLSLTPIVGGLALILAIILTFVSYKLEHRHTAK